MTPRWGACAGAATLLFALAALSDSIVLYILSLLAALAAARFVEVN